jgi:hypothetical protein
MKLLTIYKKYKDMKLVMKLLCFVVFWMVCSHNYVQAQCGVTIQNYTPTVCPGGSFIQMKATASVSNASYSWLGPSGLEVSTSSELYLNNITSDMEGMYRVIARNSDGCVANNVAFVTFSSLSIAPTGISVANNSTCYGTSKILTPTGGSKGNGAVYKWYSSSGTYLYTGDNYTVNPSVSTSYMVKIEGTCNTTPSASETVIVTQLVAPSKPTTSNSICPGGTTFFNSSSPFASSYEWHISNQSVGGFLDLSIGNVSWSTNILNPITVTVSVIAIGCGSVSSEVFSDPITINPRPSTPTASSYQSFCGPMKISDISVSPAENNCVINWFDSNGLSLPFSTSLTNGATYYAESSNTTTGCVSPGRKAVTVTVNPLPAAPTAAPTQTFCEGAILSNLRANAPSGSRVSWYRSASGESDLVGTTVLTNGTIYFAGSVNKTTGCESSSRASVTATIKTAPRAYVATSPQIFCNGLVVDNIAYTTQDAYEAHWYDLATGGTEYAGSAVLTSGKYYLEALDYQTDGCVSLTRTEVVVTVKPLLAAPTLNTQSVIGSGSVLCSIADPIEGITYKWYNNDNAYLATDTYISTTLAENSSLQYKAFAFQDNCSSSESSLSTAYAYKLPVIASTSDIISTGGQVTLSVNKAFEATPYSNIQWMVNNSNIPGATAESIIVNRPGEYSVRVGMTGVPIPVTSSSKTITNVIQAQSNMNFIEGKTILRKDIKDISDIDTISISGIQEIIQYFDGLGRPMQTVNWKASPKFQDIIQPIIYDDFGRESIKYLPYSDGTDGSYKTDALTKQAAFYNNTDNLLAKDIAPWSKTLIEPSPLNRVMGQGAPGTTWQPVDGNYDAGHTTKFVYEANTTSDVRLLEVDASNNNLVNPSDSYYLAGELYKTITKDENWVSGNLHTTEEFKDKQGQVVLKRTYVKNEQGNIVTVDTYYVYDDFGLLRYVIPPKTLASISFPADKNNAIIKSLCYYYEYDSRNRMVIKQLPGAEPVYMVYDTRDRLVASQDGKQRNHKNSNNQPDPLWMFTKYDSFNRPIMTGIIGITGTPDAIQSDIYSYESTQNNLYENVVASGTIGYTITQSYPSVTEADLLSVTFYDNYLFPSKQEFTSVPDLTVTSNNDKVVGKVTGGKVRILGNSTKWLTNTVYYDDKYRVIQSIKTNQLMSGETPGFDRVTNLIDFAGRILKSFTEHTGTAAVNTIRRFEYDHAGRLLRIWHKVDIDTSPEILMSYMVYNELGQLVDKKIHSSDQGVNYLQSIDYRYNIRGWLTKINSPETVGVLHPNEGNVTMKPDAFGMEIRYVDPF